MKSLLDLHSLIALLSFIRVWLLLEAFPTSIKRTLRDSEGPDERVGSIALSKPTMPAVVDENRRASLQLPIQIVPSFRTRVSSNLL